MTGTTSVVDEWRDIKGYDGKYQVSNTGKIRALDYHRSGIIKELALKGNRGYLCVGLTKDARKRFFAVHRLVAATFLGDMGGEYQVNHKNLDKADNRVANLEWVTPRDNTVHAISNGRFKGSAAKLQMANERRKKKIIAETDGARREFRSIREASSALGVDRKQINQSLIGQYPVAKGWRFYYAELRGGDAQCQR